MEQGIENNKIQKAVFQLKNISTANSTPNGIARKIRLPKPANNATQITNRATPIRWTKRWLLLSKTCINVLYLRVLLYS
jgi:hypothetical protein